MAAEWIPLARAFELVLATEQDTVLAERLLTLFLWNGQLPAVSRRAFVENELSNDLPVVTNNDWRWAECPIIFDWQNSRGLLPRGTFRPSRNEPIREFGFTEYFRIELEWAALAATFPLLNKDEEDRQDPILRTGVVGHPTSRHIVEAEINKRVLAGEKFKNKTAAAEALEQWLNVAYSGKAPAMSAKAMLNSLSSKLSELVG